jgi:hypothetical protein
MLEDIDPEINRFRDSWETGKADWERQLRLASTHIIQDLKRRGLIVHPGQILVFDDVTWATAYKALELIYRTLGEGYSQQKEDAKAQSEEFLDQKRFTFDLTNDAQVDPGEINRSAIVGIR